MKGGDRMRKLLLCRPCAEKLKAAFRLEPLDGRTEKNNCAECGKRRYVAAYRVGWCDTKIRREN